MAYMTLTFFLVFTASSNPPNTTIMARRSKPNLLIPKRGHKHLRRTPSPRIRRGRYRQICCRRPDTCGCDRRHIINYYNYFPSARETQPNYDRLPRQVSRTPRFDDSRGRNVRYPNPFRKSILSSISLSVQNLILSTSAITFNLLERL